MYFLVEVEKSFWHFKIQHKFGKLHIAPDAMSAHPVETICETEDKVEITSSKMLARIQMSNNEYIIASHQVGDHLLAVTFDCIKEETSKDEK